MMNCVLYVVVDKEAETVSPINFAPSEKSAIKAVKNSLAKAGLDVSQFGVHFVSGAISYPCTFDEVPEDDVYLLSD